MLSFLSRKRAVGKGTRRRGGGILLLRECYFPNDGKVTKGSPGDAAIGPAVKPPGPPCRLTPGPRYGRRIPGSRSSQPARVVQLIAPASAPLPLAGQVRESPAGWTMESAPGTSSRRGGSGNGGPMRTSAPTPNLGFFAGGWYPPLRSQQRESLKKPGRVGNSRVQTAEMANQHLTNISGGGAVGILGQNPNFLIHVERKHHRNAFFLVRHIIHLRDILREYPLKVNEQGGTTS